MRPCFQRCIVKTAWTVPQDSPAEQDTRGEIAVQRVHSRQNRGGSMQKQSAEWQPYAAHFEFKQMLIWKHFGKLCPIHSVHLAVDTYWYYIVSIYRFFIKKSTETGRTNFFFSILPVKIPVAQPRITSPSAYSPLRPDTHSKIPLQGCWDGFRAIRHNALFFQFFFNQCRTACSMPKGISLNTPLQRCTKGT